MTHPMAFPNTGGFEDRNGNDVKAGDKVLYLINGRKATLDEALQDGDAYVTYEDGTHGNIKWNHLIKI